MSIAPSRPQKRVIYNSHLFKQIQKKVAQKSSNLFPQLTLRDRITNHAGKEGREK